MEDDDVETKDVKSTPTTEQKDAPLKTGANPPDRDTKG